MIILFTYIHNIEIQNSTIKFLYLFVSTKLVPRHSDRLGKFLVNILLLSRYADRQSARNISRVRV